MILCLSTHHVNAGYVQAAIERIDAHGALMAASRGFVTRHRLLGEDPSTIVTVAVWRSRDDLERWIERRDELPGREEATTIYRGVTVEVFTIAATQQARDDERATSHEQRPGGDR